MFLKLHTYMFVIHSFSSIGSQRQAQIDKETSSFRIYLYIIFGLFCLDAMIL